MPKADSQPEDPTLNLHLLKGQVNQLQAIKSPDSGIAQVLQCQHTFPIYGVLRQTPTKRRGCQKLFLLLQNGLTSLQRTRIPNTLATCSEPRVLHHQLTKLLAVALGKVAFNGREKKPLHVHGHEGVDLTVVFILVRCTFGEHTSPSPSSS